MNAPKSKRFLRIQRMLPNGVMQKLLQKGNVIYNKKKYSIKRVKNLHNSII